MDSSDAIQIGTIILLLVMSAFFSSAETALTTVNKIRIRSLVEEGNKRAETLMKVTDDAGKMLSAILIGNNIVNLSASSLATAFAIEKWGSVSAGLATGLLTILILVFGEISPKTLSTLYSEKISLKYAKIILLLMKLLTPVIFIINKLSMGFLMLFRIDPTSKVDSMTENELRTIVEVSHEDGVIESEEREMIYNVFDLGDSQAKDIMIPRIDMTFANINNSYEEIIEIFREEKYTRLPVYENTTDNVIGIINVKDLLLYDQKETFRVQDILRNPYYTYEYKNTYELMLQMRENPINVAIVLDEYGATAGMITLEDLLEEIVGEIRDEYDADEDDPIQKINEYEYLAEGSMKLDDLNDFLDLNLASEDYDSIGGLIIEHLDHLPAAGESVTTREGIRLIAEIMEKNRIEKVRIYLKPDDSHVE